MPQLRQNIVTGDWAVIAPERAKRPSDFVTAGMVRREHRDTCPFCVGGPAWKTRLPGHDLENDQLFIIPNKFPAFVPDAKMCSLRSFPEEDFYTSKPSVGGHDVIIAKEHDLRLYDFSPRLTQDLLAMYHRRYQHYRGATCQPAYTMAIYNYGVEAGASIWHPHGQVFASSIVPNLITKETRGADHYYEQAGVCVFCDLLAHELKFKTRLLVESDRFASFTFYAARFPFEVWILPKRHTSRFEDASTADLADLADVLLATLRRLDQALNNPPVNFFIHSLPNVVDRSAAYHWHLEIAPRLATYGGFEMGGSTIIDIVSPEKAAVFLRESHQRPATKRPVKK